MWPLAHIRVILHVPCAGTSSVYIWEAIYGPFNDVPNPVKEFEWFGILWNDTFTMKGYFALEALMVPIPRGAKALQQSGKTTDVASAVFIGDGKVIISMVNDLDDEKVVEVKVGNAQFVGDVTQRSWPPGTNIVPNVANVGPDIAVSATLPRDSLVTVTVTCAPSFDCSVR
jgi:hypothetical protein